MNTAEAQTFYKETSYVLSRLDRQLDLSNENSISDTLRFTRYLLWSGLLAQFKSSNESAWPSAPFEKALLANQVERLNNKCLNGFKVLPLNETAPTAYAFASAGERPTTKPVAYFSNLRPKLMAICSDCGVLVRLNYSQPNDPKPDFQISYCVCSICAAANTKPAGGSPGSVESKN